MKWKKKTFPIHPALKMGKKIFYMLCVGDWRKPSHTPSLKFHHVGKWLTEALSTFRPHLTQQFHYVGGSLIEALATFLPHLPKQNKKKTEEENKAT